MEGLFGRDNNRLGNSTVTGVSTGTLNGGFIGFGPRVAEKGLVPNRVGTKPIGECGVGWNEVQVGYVMHLLHLLGDGGRQGRVVVTEGASGNS